MPGKPYYITTAIAYPNGVPHIGHAYEAIATDAIARFKRLDGDDVFFLTGTDEHGSKMVQTAAREGVTPRQLVERNVTRFQAMVKMLNCSNDDFIRTTEPRHYRASEAIWEHMQAAGDIYLDKYAGWYSVRDEAYYAESETRIDDKGQRLGPNGTPVEWVEEESYFFRLSAYQDKLLELYASDPNYVMPKERFNEVISFVSGGLQDLSISRTTFDWGVPVPGNPKHVMYVWVDALTNYITAVGYPDTNSAMFKKFWPADLHVIGKDIVRFHAVYWPAFLMSAGVAVPRRIFSHGFLFNRSIWSKPTAPIRCAISSCAKCRSARTAITATKPSSTAPTPTLPTISAIWRSARSRWWRAISAACCRSRARSPEETRRC
jgi:methionyl-tRNA synthetase